MENHVLSIERWFNDIACGIKYLQDHFDDRYAGGESMNQNKHNMIIFIDVNWHLLLLVKQEEQMFLMDI